MMGKNHAKQGVCGVLIIGAAASVALRAFDISVAGYAGVLAVSAILVVSGATYADIDAEGSHATVSYGWISHLLHSITHLITQSLYHSTLGTRDRPKKGSHRLLTHTALGNIGAGLVLTGICYANVYAASIAVGFLIGMAVTVWRKRWKWIAWFLGTLVAFGTYDPRMLWIWGVAFTLGNMIHCFGDSCTKSGTPWFWPMERNGQRWGARHAVPENLRIKTGTANERILLWLTYACTLAIVVALGYIGSLV